MMLAVVGDLVEDVVVWLDRPLQVGTDNPARVFRSRGGSAANVAVLAARAVPTRFIGRVGDDPLGDHLIQALRKAGVDARVQRGGRTGSIVVLVDADGERTMLPDRAASAELTDVPPAWLDGVTALHVPAYGFPQVDAFVGTAVEKGIRVTVDASSTAVLEGLGVQAFLDRIREIRPSVLFANAMEARMLGDNPTGGVLVVKNGPHPARVVEPGGRVTEVPARPVERARDSTGAGDAFAAAYLTAMLEGQPPVECARRGHELASVVLTTPGAAQ